MPARLLALALVLSVCVHLANDVLDADASISCAADFTPARVAKDWIAREVNPAPTELLAREFFRPPLSPRLA